MPLREVGPMPPVLELMRFLASSITFMVRLSEVGVFVDGHCIGRIKKLPRTIQAVGVSDELHRSSPLGVMNVQEIQCRREPGFLCIAWMWMTIFRQRYRLRWRWSLRCTPQGLGYHHRRRLPILAMRLALSPPVGHHPGLGLRHCHHRLEVLDQEQLWI